MFKQFLQLETNLRRAGYILLLEVIGGAALAALLSHFGINTDLAVLFLWVANLPVAWFLAQAAKHQGRNPWLFGFICLPPLLALVNFFVLRAMAPHYKPTS